MVSVDSVLLLSGRSSENDENDEDELTENSKICYKNSNLTLIQVNKNIVITISMQHPYNIYLWTVNFVMMSY